VLSDHAIKMHCPEYFPLDMNSRMNMHPVSLKNSAFTGVKEPREQKMHENFSRYPVNDLVNYAYLAAPGLSKQAILQSVYEYRNEVGSDNVGSSYREQIRSTHTPRLSTRTALRTPSEAHTALRTPSEAHTALRTPSEAHTALRTPIDDDDAASIYSTPTQIVQSRERTPEEMASIAGDLDLTVADFYDSSPATLALGDLVRQSAIPAF
jgi:hypothetical protein